MSHDIVCVIPARYGSTRLPGKPLCEINELPLVMWVYNSAMKAGVFDRLSVVPMISIGDAVKSRENM